MPNNYLSVLYKHIIRVENENVGLKVGGTNIPLPPTPNQKSGGRHMLDVGLLYCFFVTDMSQQLVCHLGKIR